MNAKMIQVQYDNSEEGMYGIEGANGYDTAASEAKFEQHLSTTLRNEYPSADIEITPGAGRYIVDGSTSSREAERVGQIVHNVWSEFDWLVKA